MLRNTIIPFIILAACGSSGQTSFKLNVSFVGTLNQLALTGIVRDGDHAGASASSTLPDPPRNLASPTSVIVLLPDEWDGATIDLTVDGVGNGPAAGHWAGSAKAIRGKQVSFEVALAGVADAGVADAGVADGAIDDASEPHWQAVEGESVGTTTLNMTSLFVDDRGVPYVAFRDSDHNNKVTVKKYDKGWQTVGTPESSTNAPSSFSLFVDQDGVVYVASISSLAQASVMTYGDRTDGGAWQPLGNPMWPAARQISLFVGNGVPFVAYLDHINTPYATVMKYEGDGWHLVGETNQAQSGSISLFVDQGIPYVAYIDSPLVTGRRATVMTLEGNGDGGVWQPVGSPGGASNLNGYALSLFVNQGVPYLASTSLGDSPVSVKKFEVDGGAWRSVGDVAASQTLDNQVSLFVVDGISYVAYKDDNNGSRVTVKTCANGACQLVGEPIVIVADDEAQGISLSLDTRVQGKSVPYVSFADWNGTSGIVRVMVYK